MKVSIRHKFIIGLLIIFCIGYSTMSFCMNKLIVQNNKSIIKKELLIFQKDLTLYLKQYFQIENLDMNLNNFDNHAVDIALKLSGKIENRVILHSEKGQFLADSTNANGQVLNYKDIGNSKTLYEDSDLKLALSNKSSFSIVPVKDKYIVVFSCPIVSEDNRVGIVRCIRDYSEIFSSNNELLKLVNTFMLLVFGVVFLFIILLSTRITIPIIKLSKGLNEVADGNFEAEINIKSKDEIGELSLNFNKMKEQIKNQIEIIQKDRDNLEKLESHRKVFFDNITHEMKTPLTIISGYSQIIINQDFKDIGFLRKSVKKIKDESERMHTMVLDLLEISKCESDINFKINEDVNISKTIDSICNDMKIRADKYEIIIDKDIEENVFILGNSNELRRVMINLIDNSIKYGNIKSSIKIKLFKADDSCNIVVEDKGQGIPEDNLKKIFEPFYRIDKQSSREKGSCGLGLSIVKSIIDKHNGEIKINSTVQVGTTVYIKIPMKVYKMATSG